MTQQPPPEFEQWMAQHALALVPVAAKELLDDAVGTKVRLLALERTVRDLAADRFDDNAVGHLIAGYQARIVELEQIIEKQNHKIARRAS